ncbi:MAG: hypothetical protein ACRDMI_17770 [Streptosporangiaceae bacterium]
MLLSVAASAVLAAAAVVAGLSLTLGNQTAISGLARGAGAANSPATSPPESAIASMPSTSGSGKKSGSHGAKPQVLRSINCGPDPHLCGFPDATNTGVPAGMALRSVPGDGSSGPGWTSNAQGDVEVSGNGAVFEGHSVHGYIDVTGSNVTIKDNAISNSGNDIDGDGINLSGNPGDVTIENNTISSPNGSSGNGIFAGIKDINGEARGTQVLGNNIADASTGVQIYIGLIENNYIHDETLASPSSHLNGTTSNGSTIPLTIQHNTVFNPNGQTDAVSLFEDFGPEANVVINNNLLAGGGYVVYGGQNPGGPQAYNIRITNNRFSTIYYHQSGYYGYITAFNPNAPGNVWSGNVWDSNNKPLSS